MRPFLFLLALLLLPSVVQAGTFEPVQTGQLTNLSTTVSNSSAQAVAASGTRKYLFLFNKSAVNICCNPFGQVASCSTSSTEGSIVIPSNWGQTFESSFITTSAWTCIAASGSGNALNVWVAQ